MKCAEARVQMDGYFLAKKRFEESEELTVHVISCRDCKLYRTQFNDIQNAYARIERVAPPFELLQKLNRDVFTPANDDSGGRTRLWIGLAAVIGIVVVAWLMFRPDTKQNTAEIELQDVQIAAQQEKKPYRSVRIKPVFDESQADPIPPPTVQDPWETLQATREEVINASGADRFALISDKLKKDLQANLDVGSEQPLSVTDPAENSVSPLTLQKIPDKNLDALPSLAGAPTEKSAVSDERGQILMRADSPKNPLGSLPSEVKFLTVNGVTDQALPPKLLGLPGPGEPSLPISLAVPMPDQSVLPIGDAGETQSSPTDLNDASRLCDPERAGYDVAFYGYDLALAGEDGEGVAGLAVGGGGIDRALGNRGLDPGWLSDAGELLPIEALPYYLAGAGRDFIGVSGGTLMMPGARLGRSANGGILPGGGSGGSWLGVAGGSLLSGGSGGDWHGMAGGAGGNLIGASGLGSASGSVGGHVARLRHPVKRTFHLNACMEE